MKLKNFGTTTLIAVAVLTFAACKKNSVSPASTKPQMSFQLKADNSTLTLASLPGGSNRLLTNSTASGVSGVTFTSGMANIARFKLEAKRNDTEIEITSKNLNNIDLFAINPSIVGVTLDTGTYKEIEIRVMLQKTVDTSAIPLKLMGTFTNSGGTAVPFEIDVNDDATIKTEADNITVSSTTDFTALVTMHLNLLLNGLAAADFESATLTNNTIMISGSSNTSIYNKILSNLSSCGHGEFSEHRHDGGDNGGHDGGGNH